MTYLNATAIQVRRGAAPSTTGQRDGLEVCLACWKEWMGKRDLDLSAQRMKTLQGDGDGYGSPDTSQARRDNEIAEATDAMFASLKPAHQWAIRYKCGVAIVWRFPELDYVTEALAACVELEKKLRGNIATRMEFV